MVHGNSELYSTFQGVGSVHLSAINTTPRSIEIVKEMTEMTNIGTEVTNIGTEITNIGTEMTSVYVCYLVTYDMF